jgi:hypothetical protein
LVRPAWRDTHSERWAIWTHPGFSHPSANERRPPWRDLRFNKEALVGQEPCPTKKCHYQSVARAIELHIRGPFLNLVFSSLPDISIRQLILQI